MLTPKLREEVIRKALEKEPSKAYWASKIGCEVLNLSMAQLFQSDYWDEIQDIVRLVHCGFNGAARLATLDAMRKFEVDFDGRFCNNGGFKKNGDSVIICELDRTNIVAGMKLIESIK